LDFKQLIAQSRYISFTACGGSENFAADAKHLRKKSRNIISKSRFFFDIDQGQFYLREKFYINFVETHGTLAKWPNRRL
jgi:hypothetical protein